MTTSATAIKYFVNELSNGKTVTLREIWDYVRSQGIDKEEAKVYADCSVLASNGYISRGKEKRTYCAAVKKAEREKIIKDIKPATIQRQVKQEIKGVDDPGKPPKTRRVKEAIYTTESVLAGLEAALGKPLNEQPKDTGLYGFALTGEQDHNYILTKTERVIGRKPSVWCIFMTGSTTCVGLQ